MAIKITDRNNKTNKAVAFFNYEIKCRDGSYYRAAKGLPLFQNPEYPDSDIDNLIAQAEKNNGSITLNMRVTINMAKPVHEISPEHWDILIK